MTTANPLENIPDESTSENAERTSGGALTKEEHQRWAAATSTGMHPANANRARPNIPVGAPFAAGIIVTDKEAPFHPSPSLDPLNITKLEHFEDFKDYLQPAVYALSLANESLKAIDKAHVQLRKDGSKTDEQKLLVIAGPAEKAFDKIHAAFVTANTKLSEAVNAMEQQLQSPVQQKAGLGTVNEEIRRHVKSLPNDQRVKFVEEAFANNDSDTLTAILGCPPFLSGLGKVEHGYYLRKLHETRAPAVVKKLNTTRATLAVLERTAPIALSSVEKAMRGTFKRAAEIRGTADKSQKALSDVLATVSGIAS